MVQKVDLLPTVALSGPHSSVDRDLSVFRLKPRQRTADVGREAPGKMGANRLVGAGRNAGEIASITYVADFV